MSEVGQPVCGQAADGHQPVRERRDGSRRVEAVLLDLVDAGGYPGLRDKGQLRLEGKEYIVKDGDVLVIRHS